MQNVIMPLAGLTKVDTGISLTISEESQYTACPL